MADNKRLTVAFVLPALIAGGAERVLITLMNNLDRERFAPVFLAVSDKGPMGDLVEKNIPMHRLGKNNVIAALPGLYRALRDLRPDIIVSTMAPMNFALLLLRPYFPRTKFIVREAITPSFLLATKKRAAPLIRFLYRRLYPRADTILCPAQAIIDEFSNTLNLAHKNILLLRNPVDTHQLRHTDAPFPTPTANRDKTVQFICAGRLHPQKGFDRLVASLPLLPSALSWRLTILGEGEERGNLESMIAHLGLQNRISLPGLNSAPWPQIGAADVFLLPSRWEGLPNVALESLACGTPVIAMKDAGGIAEIAAAANPGVIQLCDTMLDFRAAMAFVKPAPVKDFRPSLLPPGYEKHAVMTSFEAALYGAVRRR